MNDYKYCDEGSRFKAGPHDIGASQNVYLIIMPYNGNVPIKSVGFHCLASHGPAAKGTWCMTC